MMSHESSSGCLRTGGTCDMMQTIANAKSSKMIKDFTVKNNVKNIFKLYICCPVGN